MYIANSALIIDRHVIAGISIVGTLCDVMGGLYLAYDLLGGNHGPLRTLTRVVTYSLFFCVGYGLPFWFLFGPLKSIELGLMVGVGLGIVLGLEYTHATLDRAREQPHVYDLSSVFCVVVSLVLPQHYSLNLFLGYSSAS